MSKGEERRQESVEGAALDSLWTVDHGVEVVNGVATLPGPLYELLQPRGGWNRRAVTKVAPAGEFRALVVE
jgi:hypothetical protein